MPSLLRLSIYSERVQAMNIETKTVEEYLSDVLSAVEPLEAFHIPLFEARGCVSAEDVTAPWPLPAFDSSAVDGFAVLAADVSAAAADNPVTLQVLEIVQSGSHASRSIQRGGAIRVNAGGPLPENSDAVIPLEHTDGNSAQVQVIQSAVFGQFIRRAAEDVELGEVVLEEGTKIDARHLGLLASVGRGSVLSRPRPRVVIISVGDELVEPGAKLEPGKLIDSNGLMLAAAIADAGCIAYRVGPIPTDHENLQRVIEDQLVRADFVVTTGGTNADSYDALAAVASEIGELNFTRVAMQPGSAQGFGWVGDDRIPLMTIPGNPVAAYISFEVFIRPVLHRLLGRKDSSLKLQSAYSASAFTSPGGKRHYIRALRETDPSGNHIVRAIEGQGVHLIGSLAKTQCLIVVPDSVQEVRVGDKIDVLLLDEISMW
jgi:molybdopterin molybdotransferase